MCTQLLSSWGDALTPGKLLAVSPPPSPRAETQEAGGRNGCCPRQSRPGPWAGFGPEERPALQEAEN